MKCPFRLVEHPAGNGISMPIASSLDPSIRSVPDWNSFSMSPFLSGCPIISKGAVLLSSFVLNTRDTCAI